MGIILIIIAVIIARQLYVTDMKNMHPDFNKNASLFMLHPAVRGLLTLAVILLFVLGVGRLLS
jgi:NhaP-type Na+/H+ or K+/H+ antiporter